MIALPIALQQAFLRADSLRSDPETVYFELKNPLADFQLTSLEIEAENLPVSRAAVNVRHNGNPLDFADLPAEGLIFRRNNCLQFEVRQVPAASHLKVRLSGPRYAPIVINIPADLSRQPDHPQSIKKVIQQSGRSRLMSILRGGKLQAVLRLYAQDSLGETSKQILGHTLALPYEPLDQLPGLALPDAVLRQLQPVKPALLRFPAALSGSASSPAAESLFQHIDQFFAICQRFNATAVFPLDIFATSSEQATGWVNALSSRKTRFNLPVIWLLINQDVFSLSGPSINAFQLAEKIRPLIEGMHAADPEIKINVRGMPLTSADDEAAQWNRTLIQQLNGSFDKLSLQSALPGFESWQQPISGSDIGLYAAAAPAALQQVLAQFGESLQSGKSARLAIDDWNFWPAVVPENNQSIFPLPSLTQALYTAAMLNGFSRQPRVIAWAAHSALFGDLGLIQTDGQQAYAAPAAAVFAMQQNMETLALKTAVESPAFQLDAYGNIPALKIPYVDVAATRSRSARRVVLSIVNWHPTSRLDLSVRLFDFESLTPRKAWLLKGEAPDEQNSFAHPDQVRSKEVDLRSIGNRSRFTLDLPPYSYSLVTLEE
jgi:hypothetical protein